MGSPKDGPSAVLADDVDAAAGTPAADRHGGGAAVATRALRSVAGVFIVTWAFRISGYVTFASWSAIPIVVLGLAACSPSRPRGSLSPCSATAASIRSAGARSP